MKTIKSSVLFFTVLTTCLLLTSCVSLETSSDDFLIKVDSIRAPVTVSSGESFDIEFFGTIGFDECNSFKTFNQVDKKNEIQIEAVGTFNSSTDTCPPQLVLLDGQKLNLTISIPGAYRIVIKEPEAFVLVQQITVN